jgi:RHS repeat-associated protein
MNLGYMSKPFSLATGFYNYGFRDYKPQAARFTTVDPIRDGNNWFVYVNNDPVNYIDWLGLCRIPSQDAHVGNVPNPEQQIININPDTRLPDNNTPLEPTFFTQGQFVDAFGQRFGNNACAATSALNVISTEYTNQTGFAMTQQQGATAMQAAVNAGHVANTNARINNWAGAANSMWGTTEQTGLFTYNEQGQHQIHAIDRNRDGNADHFVNDIGNGQYRDTLNRNIGNVADLTRQAGRETRGFDFNN